MFHMILQNLNLQVIRVHKSSLLKYMDSQEGSYKNKTSTPPLGLAEERGYNWDDKAYKNLKMNISNCEHFK